MDNFEMRCRELFANRHAHGRRWKTACAQALRIGRATLYRYLEDDNSVPLAVLDLLAELEGPTRAVRSEQEMVALCAAALVEVQRHIDEYGWLKDGYPKSLRRVFDLAAALNTVAGKSWPTDLASLGRCASQPLFRWVSDLSWDGEGAFTSARLVVDGVVSAECLELAAPSHNPEAELEENTGYRLLMSLCAQRSNGEEIYRAWRRTVIEHPVLPNWTNTVLGDPELAGLERIDELVDAFYQRIPESMSMAGVIPVCEISGTLLRPDGRLFHTESRDPEAINRARAGQYHRLPYRHGALHLRRAFRRFWCLPGKAELELDRGLRQVGWTCTLWPQLDRVDLLAESPAGRKIAVDVKDYLSPVGLGARFEGFKEYERDHECYLVVPDYVPEIDPNFDRRFVAHRKSFVKTAVSLRTVSSLLIALARS